MRFLLHVVGEGPVEMMPLLSSVFLHLVDSPRTRSYFTVGMDLEVNSTRLGNYFRDNLFCRSLCLGLRTPMGRDQIILKE